MRCGFVYPASTAANGLEVVVPALENGSLAPEQLPYYYRWAVFDEGGELLRSGPMSERRLEYARQALAGDLSPKGVFYTQYHKVARLPDGTGCVVQYDYSMPYGTSALQRRMPEFQTCALLLLLAAWLIAGAAASRHFAGLLRRDAALLTGAARTITDRRLDLPFAVHARVQEFDETLQAMETLRASLAASLQEQWAMEQQRSLELAALTHDLKTPLSIVSGNAELLAEDALTAAQRQNVEAILRGALRLEDYVAQLRTMAASGPEGGGRKETVELRLLAEGWQSADQGFCAAKQIAFHCVGAPAGSVTVHRVSLDRAVGNLLDNAVRYTPRGGEISLTLHAAGGRLSVAVEDSGPGFSAGALAKGDQPFFTSDASRPQSGHLGLGLYFAGRVAKSHGGELRLSNTGRGGRAELLLPLG
ncbi:sensor histidine kinase [Candidatus Allofournierella excrementigallinarum]|uniref:sensor histidine kinase n=1 Tax=Candidatus Allofournierella excrementigallinarum TaxID=2838592 RepID=UPI00374FBFCB